MIQISKNLNAPYGLYTYFLFWSQMTSRGFQRPNTYKFITEVKNDVVEKVVG